MADRFRIEKHTEDKWWNPEYPPPGWWLIWKGRTQVHKTWDRAIAAMDRKLSSLRRKKGQS